MAGHPHDEILEKSLERFRLGKLPKPSPNPDDNGWPKSHSGWKKFSTVATNIGNGSHHPRNTDGFDSQC